MTKKILVTGGAGFIGSFLIDELLKSGYSVRVFDDLEPQVHMSGEIPDYLNKNIDFVKGDVRNLDGIKKALEGVDAVFHFAAMVGVGQSMYEISKYVDVNITGTANLMDAIVNTKNNVRKVAVASSMSIYGEGAYFCDQCNSLSSGTRNPEQIKKHEWEVKCSKCSSVLNPTPVTEDKKIEAASIYAISKKAQEDIVMNIGKAYQIPVVGMRYFNVYGPRQSLNNPYTGVAAIFISRIKNQKPPMVFEDGNQMRDFVSVYDITQANILALESHKADYEVFNVGSGRGIKILQLAEKLLNLMKSDMKPEIVYQYREGDIRHCYPDISKIKRKLGFSPRIGMDDGLRELIEWSEHENAIDKVQQAAEKLRIKGILK